MAEPSETNVSAEENLGSVFKLPNLLAGGLKLNVGGLKKKAERVSFVNYNLADFKYKDGVNATERLRQLDSLHLHAPLDSECAQLNIPNSRLDLLSLKDVLYLCGGLVGARFSSEDLSGLRVAVEGLAARWSEVELGYKGLDAAAKKLTLAPVLADPADPATQALRAFHRAADLYVEQVSTLQVAVRRIQGGVDRSGPGLGKFDADPESRVGKHMPDWLAALLALYDLHHPAEAGAAAGPKKAVTVGKLAVFLGGLMKGSGLAGLSAADSEAFSVVSALPCHYGLFYSSHCCLGAVAAGEQRLAGTAHQRAGGAPRAAGRAPQHAPLLGRALLRLPQQDDRAHLHAQGREGAAHCRRHLSVGLPVAKVAAWKCTFVCKITVFIKEQ